MDYPKADRHGRPLIRPPGGSALVAHMRVTRLVKHVSDGGEGLIYWKAQRVAAGAASRRDLVEQVAAYWPPTDENKDKLNKICDELASEAAADEGKNRGDSRHERLRKENLEPGAPPWIVDPELEQVVEDYRALLKAAGLVVDPEWVERTVVHHKFVVAGSFDFLARKHGEGPLLVCDIKTGKRYAPKEAAQLGCYANADSVYDWATETHLDMPEVNKKIGLIVHLPVGEKAALHVVNLEAGWEAAQTAVWIRDYLKRKDLTRPARLDG